MSSVFSVLRDYRSILIQSQRRILYCLAHTFFSGLGQSFAFALFVPSIMADLELSSGQVGVVYSAATVFASVLLPLAGRWVDRIHLRRFSSMVGLGLFLGLLIVAGANSVLLLFCGILLMRLNGQGLLTHAPASAVSRFFGGTRGRVLGVVTLGHPLGEAIWPPLGATLILHFGWRATLICFAVLLVVIFFPALFCTLRSDDAFFNPQSSDVENTVDRKSWGRREVLSQPFFYFLVLNSVVMPFVLSGLFFHQAELARIQGWTLQWIGGSFVAFAAMRAFGGVLAGAWVDRWGARRLIPFHLLPTMLGVLSLNLTNVPQVSFFYLGMAGLSMGFASTLKSVIIVEAYGTAHIGAIRSLFAMAVVFATSLTPALFGLLIDSGVSLRNIISGSVALLAFVILVFAFGMRTFPHRAFTKNGSLR